MRLSMALALPVALACAAAALACDVPRPGAPPLDDVGVRDVGVRDAGAADADPADAGDGDEADAGDASDAGEADGVDAGVDGVDAGNVDVPDEITLLTLNLHCFKLEGTPFADTHARIDAIAHAVASNGVDVITAQEACEHAAHGVMMERLAAALASSTGVPWGSAWTFTHPAWTGTPDEAAEGVGLLFKDQEPAGVDVLTYVSQGTQERRAVAATFTTAAGTAVRVVTVHLEHGDADARRQQARETAMSALVRASNNANEGWRVLIGGDFNARAGDAPVDDMLRAGLTRLSASSDPNDTEIDHVLAPAGIEVLSSRLAFEGATEPVVSDHPGVLARLRIAPPADVSVTRFVATHGGSAGSAGADVALTLRGDVAPLGWDTGWPAVRTGPDRFEAVFLDMQGTVEHKWLLDGSTWELGPNHVVEGGGASDVAPVF